MGLAIRVSYLDRAEHGDSQTPIGMFESLVDSLVLGDPIDARPPEGELFLGKISSVLLKNRLHIAEGGSLGEPFQYRYKCGVNVLKQTRQEFCIGGIGTDCLGEIDDHVDRQQIVT